MSSFLSPAYSKTTFLDTFDERLGERVANAKQDKYDLNKSKVEQTHALYKDKLKGLRDFDNEYIAAKLDEAKRVVGGYGNKDFSLSSTTDALLGNITAVTDDPIVRNAILNKNKYDTVATQVAKKKEKGDGKYSDQNWTDALEQGNYYKYLKGEVKEIGSIDYTDYVDAENEQDKKAADYAKERGLKDQFLGRTSDAYETTDKYGVKVTREEIQEYLRTTVDSKTKNQLQINARQSLGKYKDEDFNTYMSENQKQENTNIKERIASAKAERDTVADDKKKDYTTYIGELEKKLADGELKFKNGKYDKSEIYNVYENTFFKNIASNHDIDIITKLDTSDMPFEIMKFETETKLKLREIELKEEENKILKIGSNGTMTETPKPVVEKELTKLQEQQQATYKTAQALDEYLLENNPEYKKMGVQERWNYKMSLDPSTPFGTGNTTQLSNLVNAFKEAQGGYSKIVANTNKKITDDVELAFNDLDKNQVNIKGLSETMPITASLLRGNKNYSNLNPEEKLAVTTEWANNNLQYGNLEGDVKTVYEKLVIQNTNKLKKSGTPTAKSLIKQIESQGTSENVGGYWANRGRDLKDAVNNVLTIPTNIILRNVAYLPNQLIFGTKYADSQMKSFQDAQKEMNIESDKNDIRFNKATADLFGSTDNNITHLDGRDTKSGKDVWGRFTGSETRIQNSINEIAATYQENRKTGQAFTFSTADKQQAQIALKLRAAVINANGEHPIPEGTNDYTVAREGDGFRISFIMGKSDKAMYDSVFVSKLPPEVAGIYDVSVQNWTNNPNNPNIKLEPKTVQPYTTLAKRDMDITSLIKNRMLPDEVINTIQSDPASTMFATTSELKDKVKAVYGENFYKEHSQKIEEILSNNYKATPYVSAGVFKAKITYTEDGEEKEYRAIEPLGTEKDDHGFYLAYMEIISKLKSEKISKLK
jgi:hypothetical protein